MHLMHVCACVDYALAIPYGTTGREGMMGGWGGGGGGEGGRGIKPPSPPVASAIATSPPHAIIPVQ